MILRYFSIISILLILSFFSCGRAVKDEKQIDPAVLKEPLIIANKNLVKSESEDIDNFIKRYRWKMSETGTGLRYMVYENGTGRKPVNGETVVIEYTVKLLSGDTVGSSLISGPSEFMIGKNNVIAGLHEGIMLLREGDKAKMIVPSHLAFGLTGLPGKIPPGSVLVYDIELIEIK